METQTDRDTIQVSDSNRVAVVAKYLGPTDTLGTRIRVHRGDHRQGDKTLTVGWDYALNTHENYAAAIRQYVELMGWGGRWTVGGTQSGAVGVWAGWAE